MHVDVLLLQPSVTVLLLCVQRTIWWQVLTLTEKSYMQKVIFILRLDM